MKMDTPDARVAAVLHDVVEDTARTIEGLRKEGFSESVLRAVGEVTRRLGESYEDFVLRADKDTIVVA